MTLIAEAREFAQKHHARQVYGPDERPYVWHLEKVADLSKRLGYPDEVLAVCWLHDVVEDTDVTIDDLKSRFPSIIVDAVEALTFVKGVDKDKIAKAKTNTIAHVVKYCDAAINFSVCVLDGPKAGHSQWEVSVTRYPKYLAELLKGLPKPEECT